jgi:hypothetical protein
LNPAARRLLPLAVVSLPFVAGIALRRPEGGWVERPAIHARRTGRFADPRLNESSGVVRGRRDSSVLWTVNDSGNEPLLFAVDTGGTTRGVFRLQDVPNVDWEAIGAGPCGTRWCLYLGDVGDNRGVRPTVTVYRVEEPAIDGAAAEAEIPVLDRQAARYPDGPHDAEAMVVAGDADVYLLTKGREGVTRTFHLPPDRWGTPTATLDSAPPVPIRVGFLVGTLVTDAALSGDGGWLAVRTYSTVYLFDRAPGTTGLPTRPRAACAIRGLGPLGEGIAWWDWTTLVTTSEAIVGPAPIAAFACPVP